jgi:hypothetical protein
VNVGNFPATQPVSGTVTGNQGSPNTAANGWPVKVTDGTNTAQVLNAAPGSDTGQSALAVRVVSQLGAGSGGGGSAGTIDAPADNKSPTLAQHVQAFLSCFDGTDWDRLRGDTANGLDVDVTRVQGTVAVSGPLTDAQLRAAAVPVSGTFFQATQPVSGTVTANAGIGPWPVTDNGGSLTVDAPVGTPLRVDPTGTTTQPVSLAAVPTVTEKQDQPASTTATWTSATTGNTALTNSAVSGYGTANVSIQVPSTVTAGVITLEVSDDGAVWYPAGAVRVDNAVQENAISLASGGAALNRMYAVSVDAMTNIRARLSTVITGTGNVVVRIGLVAGGIEPFVANVARKDNGRTNLAWTVSSFVTTAVAEALLTVTESRDGAATSTFTSKVITSGKRLRITSITAGLQGGGTAPVLSRAYVRVRVNTAGAVTTASPLQLILPGSPPASAKGITTVAQTYPDGVEFAGNGTTQIGFTFESPDWVTGTNIPILYLSVFGFEY